MIGLSTFAPPLRAFALAVALAALAACGAAPQSPGGAAAPTAPATSSGDAAVATAYPEPTIESYPDPGASVEAYPAPLGGAAASPAATAAAGTTAAPTRPAQAATRPALAATAAPTAAPTAVGQSGPAALPPGLTTGAVPADKAAVALADLAQRTGAAPGAVTVVSAEAVEWSDGSLGCPREGMAYPQVISPGYRLVLAVAGREYAYHGSDRGDLFYCENPSR